MTVEQKLAEPFDPKDVKFKPQMVKNNRALAMAYIDARLVQDRLDEAVGVSCWQDEYTIDTSGSVVCRLSVRLNGEWIVKTDVGSLSEQDDAGDRLKAAFSDALKRAAVKFGVGRYLYRLAAQWVDYDSVKKQLLQLPQLPAFALPKKTAAPPASAPKPQPQPQPVKPDPQAECGPDVASRISGFIGSLAESRKVPAAKITADMLVYFGYAANHPLDRVQTQDAVKMLQSLKSGIEAEAKKTPVKSA